MQYEVMIEAEKTSGPVIFTSGDLNRALLCGAGMPSGSDDALKDLRDGKIMLTESNPLIGMATLAKTTKAKLQ